MDWGSMFSPSLLILTSFFSLREGSFVRVEIIVTFNITCLGVACRDFAMLVNDF